MLVYVRLRRAQRIRFGIVSGLDDMVARSIFIFCAFVPFLVQGALLAHRRLESLLPQHPAKLVPLLVVASSNDHYCPIEVAEQMAKRWGAGFVCVGARGHISTELGNKDWQEGLGLLEAFASGLGVRTGLTERAHTGGEMTISAR